LVAEHFNIPHLQLRQEALKDGAARLASKVCHYRGYVLEMGALTYEEIDDIFRYEFEIEPVDGEVAVGDSDNDEPLPKMERRVKEELRPEFFVVLQAPEPLCRARWKERGSELEEFKVAFAQHKKADGVEVLGTDFFQNVMNLDIFNLPIAGKDEEELFESIRIYMEKMGRPFNFLQSEEEVAVEVAKRREDKDAAIAGEVAAKEEQQANQEADKEKESKQCHQKRMRTIAKYEEERQKIQDMPLREYCMKYMIPDLTEGLIEMCKVLPENPLEYLANYLEKHAPDDQQ